jgi:hypothetical protein
MLAASLGTAGSVADGVRAIGLIVVAVIGRPGRVRGRRVRLRGLGQPAAALPDIADARQREVPVEVIWPEGAVRD